jgi:hypothetical protein
MNRRKQERQLQAAHLPATSSTSNKPDIFGEPDEHSERKSGVRVKRAPTEVEREGIATARRRTKKRPPSVAVVVRRAQDGRLHASPEHSDREGHAYRMADTLGTRSLEFVSTMMNSIGKATEDHSKMKDFGPGSVDQTAVNAALAVIDGVRPADEIEAMLAAHMAVTNIALLELVARTRGAIAGHLYQGSGLKRLDVLGNLTAKFMRTYAMQVEALAKKRRRGEQTVTVRHVHVHAGGQAVVGNVTHRGGRGITKNEHRPTEIEQANPTSSSAPEEWPMRREN